MHVGAVKVNTNHKETVDQMVPPPSLRRGKRSRPFSAKPRSAAVAAALSSLLLLVYVAAIRGADAFAPRRPPSLHLVSKSNNQNQQGVVNANNQRRITGILKSSGDEEGEEWRAFRARLVQNGLPSLNVDNKKANVDDTTSSRANESSNGRYAHESTPLIEVGTILLSIPTTDLCQALEQQYWHRAVVLITEVSENSAKGDVETVPVEQLAEGKNKGRWSYRGILLNRFTKLVFDSATGEQMTQDSKGAGWNIQFGGTLLGLDSSDGYTEFVCLHRLDRTDPNVREVSTKLFADLSIISLSDAQSLCKLDSSKFSPDNFYTFGGFCSWRPGQLELEMGDERGEWMALSVDANSILEEMQHQVFESKIVTKFSRGGQNVARGLLETGANTWRNFLAMIDVSESTATERIPVGQLDFYDRMLEIWAEENLFVDEDDSVDAVVPNDDSTDLIGPGTLVRASAHVSNDMLLFENELIRSLVLVIEDTSEETVGIILNHPLAAAVECVDGKDPLPLRFGGPIDAGAWKDGTCGEIFDGEEDEEDDVYEGFLDYQNAAKVVFDGSSDDVSDYKDNSEDTDDDDSPFIWIHRDAALGAQGPDGGGGSQLGSSGVWIIAENDALKSIQSGFLCLEDSMVFSGVCIWEKDPDLGICRGGLREQIDVLQSLEVVRACNDQSDNNAIDLVWDILSKHQDVLVKETFERNIDAALGAWEICTNKMDSPRISQSSSRVDLSDAVLRAWIGVDLLGDPLGTLVEVRNDQRRELNGQ
jgi:putative AlgH/UPF0301 family transcriptional regulator